MGFSKWILRNGPGSPGHTARAIVKLYKQTNFGISSNEEKYFQIYEFRISVQDKLRNRGSLLAEFYDRIGQIINEEDMPLFVFSLECLETKQFRWGVTNDNIDDILKVIREEVEKIDNSLVKLNYQDYRNKSIYFLNEVLEFANS
ncbi:hypothetical protein [Winogradskyella pulchriflava]|uniref:Uncharacterized protein n=1 Tax=Winogradskyella pulchriflava TaxID=1110688 RepID=A0ABV6QA75_9FLAO